jgi:hypothetical protein
VQLVERLRPIPNGLPVPNRLDADDDHGQEILRLRVFPVIVVVDCFPRQQTEDDDEHEHGQGIRK